MINTLRFAVFIFLAFGAAYPQDPAREVLRKAKESADIFSGQQFVIEADLSTMKAANKPGGRYRLIWLGPQKWREDVVYGPDRLERIATGGIQYERSSSPMAGVILSAFTNLPHFRHDLDPPPDVQPQLKGPKKDGSQCVEFTFGPNKNSQKLCFVGTQLRLIKNESPWGMYNNESRWTDYREVLGKQFPFEWSTDYRGTPFFAHVQRIAPTTDAKVDPAWFATDSSFEKVSSCLDLTPGKRISGSTPRYPDQAKRERLQGEVLIRATISAQGNVENARVISSPSLLDAASLEALRDWKYSPPMCAGTPTSTLTTIRFSFTLQQ